MKTKLKFRKGVCGIFISEDGKILLGERSKDKGQWQLPQGGIEKGESPLEALEREMEEEVGVKRIKVLESIDDYISYQWPTDVFPDSKYSGQKHIYFLIDGSKIDIKKLKPTEELSNFKWFTPKAVLKNITPIKKAAYQQAFKILGLK